MSAPKPTTKPTARLTTKQEAVLKALRERPDHWHSYAEDLAEASGLTARGCQHVLYHLKDAGILDLDENGYYVKGERGA